MGAGVSSTRMTDQDGGSPAPEPATDGGVGEVQATLTEPDIAEQLAADQRQISIAEFFERNKHMLGFDSAARALVTAVKEAVDNALDAAEEAGFLPDIYVEIAESGDYYTIVVEDNGPGITKAQIPNIFGKLLYGSRFHKRAQARGQQGIGISAAVLYAQLSTGSPARITSRTPSGTDAQYFELIFDTENNEPEIQVEDTAGWERPHGTRIELTLEANMRARAQLHDYVTHTAVVNPHARIELVEPDAHFKSDRATDELPAETEAIRPHPHGVELGTLIKMLDDTDSYSVSGFLKEEFTRVGDKTAAEIVDRFRDHHFGREMAWPAPRSHDEADVEAAVAEAVANKGAEATAAFAAGVADGIEGPVSHHELVSLADRVADDVEDAFGTTFGATVRENAVDAAWAAVTADRGTHLYELIDAATSDRKDGEVVRGLADRIASKFAAGPARDRVTEATVREYVDRSADMLVEHEEVSFGETARENVVEALWSACRTVPDEVPKVRDVAGDRDTAAALLAGMREVEVMAPPTSCLSPIRADLIEEGLRKEVDADFYTAVTRDAEVHGGDPFVVEAGIAYGGDLDEAGRIDLMRFANRVPLVYQQGACAMTDVVRGIDWRNYGLDQPGGSGMPNGPAVVLVHVASTNVPFTSESKDAVANIPTIEKEVELAVREAARGLKSHLNKRRSLEKRRRKQTVIADILPKMAEKVAGVTGRANPDVDTSLARIMNNVLVSRTVEDGRVELAVENNTDAGVELDVTEIVSEEPGDLSDGTPVDVDGEWFVKWSPGVAAGERATLSYTVSGDAAFDVNVEGVAPEKLTIDR